MALINETVRLHNGYVMPKLGFGTHAIASSDAKAIIVDALDVGFRHLETAPIYLNEQAIGEAIKASKIPREAIFITSKIPPHIKTASGVARIVKRIMKNLQVDYLDALLINAPTPWGKEDEDFSQENLDVYQAMETLYDEEVIGAIGLSNFTIKDMERLLPNVRIQPHLHQLGIFIGHTLDAIRNFSTQHGMIIQGHSPLARGRIFNLDRLKEAATENSLTPAQLALRYVVDKGVYPIVKTTTKTRMQENIDINTPLDAKTLQTLDAFDEDVRDYKPPGAKWVL